MSAAERRYVEAIGRLGGDDEPVPVGALARELGVRPPSVSEMLARLASEGTVRRDAQGAARLTAKGQRHADELAGRREVVERFLAEVMRVRTEDLPAEVDRLAGVTSPGLEARMRAALAGGHDPGA